MSETITKKELVNRIADQTKQTKVVVKDVIQRFLDEIISELADGNRLEFREFGVFEVKERAARRAQNPRTLEKVDVPAKRVVKFKVGRLMRERVCDEVAPAGSSASAAPKAGPSSASAGKGPAGTGAAARKAPAEAPPNAAPAKPQPPKPPASNSPF